MFTQKFRQVSFWPGSRARGSPAKPMHSRQNCSHANRSAPATPTASGRVLVMGKQGVDATNRGRSSSSPGRTWSLGVARTVVVVVAAVAASEVAQAFAVGTVVTDRPPASLQRCRPCAGGMC